MSSSISGPRWTRVERIDPLFPGRMSYKAAKPGSVLGFFECVCCAVN